MSLCHHLLQTITSRWRHYGHDGVSNHQHHHCLLNRLFGFRSKKTSKLRVTGLCAGNSSGTGEFPAQMASNAENVSIWWRHHEDIMTLWHGNAFTPLTISGGNHRSPVDSPHNGRSVGIFYPLVWTSCWTNIWVADHLRCHDIHATSLQWFQYRLSNPEVYWKTQRQ